MITPKTPPDALASLQSLRSAWLKARTSDQRRAICEAVETSFKKPKTRGSALPERGTSKERALFERRMLVLAAHPVVSRSKHDGVEFGWEQTTIWQNLLSMNSTPFASLLKKHLRSKAPCVRHEAAAHLAEFGSDALVPLIARLLRDKDASVVRAAAWGTHVAIRRKRFSARARAAIFDQLARIATGERSLPTTDAGEEAISQACETLITIDAKRAIGLLSSSACLRPNNRSIRSVVWTLRIERTRSERPILFRKPLDAQLLWPLFDSARSGIYYQIKGDNLTTQQRARQIACSIL
ncbi:MAG: HEAT repeat domain-containing protein, partial [Planctomycetota bacterium]|nr:HEAT repeat domain-containing protein [Planctomycetota bacterium]